MLYKESPKYKHVVERYLPVVNCPKEIADIFPRETTLAGDGLKLWQVAYLLPLFAFKTFNTKTLEKFSVSLRLAWINHCKIYTWGNTVRRSKIYSSQFTHGGFSQKKIVKKVHLTEILLFASVSRQYVIFI